YPDAGSLAETAARLAELADRLSRAELTDLAAELARRLSDDPLRAAVVASTPAEAAAALRRLGEWLRAGETARLDARHSVFLGLGARDARIGFLFPGQGSPSHLDGGVLRRRFAELEPVYEMAGLDPSADPVDTAVAQPAIVAHALAGLRLLDRLGVRATAAAGHSLGEIAALCWGGTLDDAAALRLAAARGHAMADLGGEHGAMASLGAGADTTAELLGGEGAVIAAHNGPARTVISGAAGAIEAVLERARDRGIATTRLRVSHAFHSPLMASAGPRLGAEMESMSLQPLSRPVISTVTGGPLAPGADLRDLLRAQLTSPVRFAEALEAVKDEADLWIEVGPGRALAELAGEVLGAPILPLDIGGPSFTGVLAAAGAAFALGAPIDTAYLFAGRFSRPFDPERPLRFLTNPCETAPVVGVSPRNVGTGLVPARDRSILDDDRAGTSPAPTKNEQTVRALLRQLVAERAELPPEAISEDSRLLSDLHLNSISVGQLVVEASRRLGLRPPASPTDYARATVGEIAEALEEQTALGDAAESAGAPAGVDSWVRPFTVELVPRDLPRRRVETSGDRNWRIIAPPGHPLAEDLAARLDGTGVALCLPLDADERQEGLF